MKPLDKPETVAKVKRNVRDSSTTGFTLVEITVAIGIIAVALISVVALLGKAVDSSRLAAARTTSAEISSKLMGELQLVDWETVADAQTNAPSRYFDEFGEERIDESAKSDSVYTARAIVSPDGAVLATGGSPGINPHLRKVRVVVAALPGPGGDEAIQRYLDTGESGIADNLFVFQSIVTNLEKTPKTSNP